MEINVVITGSAGEGIQSIGAVFAEAVASCGYAVFTWQEFESRIRGGQSRFALRIGEAAVNAPLEGADILLALNPGAEDRYRPLLNPGGVVLSGQDSGPQSITVPFRKVAKEAFGDVLYANTVAAGALAGVLGLDPDVMKAILARRFSDKGREVVDKNQQAAEKGWSLANASCRERCPWSLSPRSTRFMLVAGNDTLPVAAAYAGCHFIAAYPMSPSTAIITALSDHARDWSIFAEQAEDEIAAINMAIGASYAGARAMTATSGGGFALMTEGVSLAGMTETPVVIVLAQRPGPATGLPTRTAQGDLLFAVHGGHGDFPKAVLAPADPRDLFLKTVRAFNLADEYQIPVILMTDQFLAESQFSFTDLDIGPSAPEFHLADPAAVPAPYRRYALTETGVSPRLRPGAGPHLVTADSDEHDEEGHITEDLKGVAARMIEKRLRKARALREAIALPEFHNVEEAELVLMGWGSSRAAILEALDLLAADGLKPGMIHFTEVWPLPEVRFPPDKQYWVVESNAAGQLARLLAGEYGLPFRNHVLRYDGLPLTAEYIRRRIHDSTSRNTQA